MDRRVCATSGCGHHVSVHVKPIGPCRLNGCSCESFRDPDNPTADEEAGGLVCFRIPEGYAMSVTFLPVGQESPDGS